MEKDHDFLQKMEAGKGIIAQMGEKVLKVVVVVFTIVILLILLQFAAFYGMFSIIETKVRVLTGLDSFLAKGIAFVLMAGFFGTSFGGLVWSFFPFPQKNKKRNRFIFLSVVAIFFFLSYFASQNVYFNSEDGTPMKYYSIRNGGYLFSSSGGYDTVTGDKFLPVTREVVASYLNSQSNVVEESMPDKFDKLPVEQKVIISIIFVCLVFFTGYSILISIFMFDGATNAEKKAKE